MRRLNGNFMLDGNRQADATTANHEEYLLNLLETLLRSSGLVSYEVQDWVVHQSAEEILKGILPYLNGNFMLDHAEIEITPEMIEAGISAIFDCDGMSYGTGFFSPTELAKKVYQAMELCRVLSHSSN